jgi:hypothetical protein
MGEVPGHSGPERVSGVDGQTVASERRQSASLRDDVREQCGGGGPIQLREQSEHCHEQDHRSECVSLGEEDGRCRRSEHRHCDRAPSSKPVGEVATHGRRRQAACTVGARGQARFSHREPRVHQVLHEEDGDEAPEPVDERAREQDPSGARERSDVTPQVLRWSGHTSIYETRSLRRTAGCCGGA